MIKLVDIAEELSLSRITVSAVLNNRHKSMGISDATAERVKSKAKEMGYRRNQLAMAMKTGKTFSFGVLIGSYQMREWMAQTLKGGYDTVRTTDYILKVEFAPDITELEAAQERLLGQRIEGLFCLNLHFPPKDGIAFRKAIDKYRVPVIGSDCTTEFSNCKVSSDNNKATRLALEHLVELGHERIAFVGGDTLSEGGLKRKESFVSLMQEMNLNLPDHYLQSCDWDIKSTEQATENLLQARDQAPTAILGASDITAMIIMRHAHKMGFRIPEDLSIIGYSNQSMTELSDPPLTVLDMHHGEVGRVALQQLVDVADISDPEKRTLSQRTTLIDPDLVLRNSTAAPRRS
ncbi:MAG: LacI family DNA-binding transcriptional regulator [Verrucomicrobiota bacterium]